MKRHYALVVLLALCGCKSSPTSVHVRLALMAGSSVPDSILLDVYDPRGRVIGPKDLGSGARLPGDVVVLISSTATAARILAEGTVEGRTVVQAAASVALRSGRESELTLVLSPMPLADQDGDGVPDTIDDCPSVPNPDQACASGSGPGDACRGSADGGVSLLPPPPPPADGGAAAAVCGNGVVEAGEACDEGKSNSDDPTVAASCTSRCARRASCGDLTNASAAAIDPASGHCYSAWQGPLSWEAAQDACESEGARLVTLGSASENTLVAGPTGGPERWIGLLSPAMTPLVFGWITGEPLTFNGFATSQPTAGAGDCVTLDPSTGWLNTACGWPSSGNLPSSPTNVMPYVCESACGNGVVDPGEGCDPPGTSCTNTCQTIRACTEAGAYSSPVNGHCYFQVGSNLTYDQALTACPPGTHLATLNEPAETAAALHAVNAQSWFALRAPTTVGQFQWDVNHENFDASRYHGFISGEPNSGSTPDCVRLVPGQGWADQPCNQPYAALCERE